VKAGETLVELDPASQALQVGEARARVSGLRPQIERLNAEIVQRENARRQERQTAAALRAEAQARYDEARAAADFAADTERRQTRLFEDKLIAEAELTKAQAETKQKRAAAETHRHTIGRLDAEHQRKDTDEQIQIERLRREAADLRAQLGVGSAAIERLQHEGALRRVTAPVAGRLAEIAPVRVGAVLGAGDKVATILPAGTLRVVAQFAPADALGRVRTGQGAYLRLEGFPWTRHGSVRATVASVAGEVRDGRVRVELDVVPGSDASIPMQHGLPGSVEVEVERLSPAALVLRAAGRRLSTSAHATGPSSPQ
jgi:membrane fusion protein (multidrug efflux system)